MAGDLLITNLDESDLDTLLACGGVLGDTIFHADRYGAESWNIWGTRLEKGLGGGRVNDRTMLPPHFYISFSISNSTYSSDESKKLRFARVVGAAIRPLTIVSAHPGLDSWSIGMSNSRLLDIFTQALERGNITFEVYSYQGKDLIDRETGKVHPFLDYMKRAKE